jgi:hypothetical protein
MKTVWRSKPSSDPGQISDLGDQLQADPMHLREDEPAAEAVSRGGATSSGIFGKASGARRRWRRASVFCDMPVPTRPALATLRPTPAHADQALALSDAFGERFGRGAHGAIAFDVGFVFGAEALDNVVAGCGVVGMVETNGLPRMRVSAVDVEGDFAGAGLAGRAGALFAKADGTGAFIGSAPSSQLCG